MTFARIGRRSAALAAAGLVMVLAAGCGSSPGRWMAPGSEDRGADGKQLDWGECDDSRPDVGDLKDITFECVTLDVPQDWNKPDSGDTFQLALIRARSEKQRDRIGSLLVNPGGPGGSGVDLASYLPAVLSQDVMRRFDVIGFDPRGVGRSSPVKCISDEDKDTTIAAEPDPVDQAQFDQIVELTRKVTQGCGDEYGERLPLVSTEQAARDMDAIRQAVGDKKLTYLGYSYGTLLGAVYAHLFPKNIRALVLDGAVDPKQDGLAASEGQAAGFELAFNNFAAWCQQQAGNCPIGPNARASVTRILGKVRATPPPGLDGRRATAGWVFTAIVASLYTESQWPVVAQALADVERGDPARVFELADRYQERDQRGRYSNLIDANSAINCADEEDPPTPAQVRQLQTEWRTKYPMFGGPLALSMLTCATWPGERDPYPVGEADGAPPIVVVGTKGDPATPYEQAPRLAELLGTGVLLTYEGEGHTAYPQSSRCIAVAVDDYLTDLKAPEDGKSCSA